MKYAVKGRYWFHGRENTQVGIFEIEDGNIEGFILDPAPESPPRHKVKGKVIQQDGKIILDFVKRPIGTLMLDIFYRLEKQKKDGKLDGRYEGYWLFKEEGVQIGIGYKPGIGEVVMVAPEKERENKAYLTLDSKI